MWESTEIRALAVIFVHYAMIERKGIR
ncbi:hypothetical protein PSCLAVI8L_480009 [Pseudoclavibacter sp. 8L]|nr:hypothetical protein PSCLAVI8L_480009 [Pseudoclavibacter sp. 8L]